MDDPIDEKLFPLSTKLHNIIPSDGSQSFEAFRDHSKRRRIKEHRTKIYIAKGPEYTRRCKAQLKQQGANMYHALNPNDWFHQPDLEDICDYISAFYFDLEVQSLDLGLKFTTATREPSTNLGVSEHRLRLISGAAHAGRGTVKMQDRKSVPLDPADKDDEDEEWSFRSELESYGGWHLDIQDLGSYIQTIVPGDACALVVLLEHSLFDPTDDIVHYQVSNPGRKYAMVSLTGLSPPFRSKRPYIRASLLWPISALVSAPDTYKGMGPEEYPILAATEAFLPFLKSDDSNFDLANREFDVSTIIETCKRQDVGLKTSDTKLMVQFWLYRVCTTVAHELGHCMGIRFHCYNTCVMENVDNSYEFDKSQDVPMAPYLCLSCLRKVIFALHIERGIDPYIPSSADTGPKVDKPKEYLRYENIVDAITYHKENPSFVAYSAWLDNMIKRYKAESNEKLKGIGRPGRYRKGVDD